jgi:EmrB/QacA subfamily drug resistance transporter
MTQHSADQSETFPPESSAKPVGGSRHRWWVLWTVLGGLFAVNVTFTIFAVTLVHVASSFHSTTNATTWVITAPLLAYGVAAPACGRIGDAIGHRRLYLVGMVLSAVLAVLTALAPSLAILIAVRALSGFVGAATGTASMALIFGVFDQEDRVKAMGWWSLVGAGGPVIGVVIGGVLIDAFGWRSLFLVQAVLVAATFVIALAVLPETARSARARFDWSGALFITLASLGLLLGLNEGPSAGWSSPLVVSSFASVPVGLALFVRAERRAASPLLPLALVRRRNFSFAVSNQFASNFAYMGGFILSPIFLERVFGFDSSRAGLTVIARPLVFSVAAPLAGYMAARIGNRVTALAGGVVLAGSMVCFDFATRSTGVPLVVIALGLSGLALGVSAPAVAASVANSVSNADLGVASAAQQLMSQLGTVAGIQVLQTVQAATDRSAGTAALTTSFHSAFLVGALAALVATSCAWFLMSKRQSLAELSLRSFSKMETCNEALDAPVLAEV